LAIGNVPAIIDVDSGMNTMSGPRFLFGSPSYDVFTLSGLDDSNGPLVGFSLALFGNVQCFDASAISLSAAFR
jgi:hypothetical protein